MGWLLRVMVPADHEVVRGAHALSPFAEPYRESKQGSAVSEHFMIDEDTAVNTAVHKHVVNQEWVEQHVAVGVNQHLRADVRVATAAAERVPDWRFGDGVAAALDTPTAIDN